MGEKKGRCNEFETGGSLLTHRLQNNFSLHVHISINWHELRDVFHIHIHVKKYFCKARLYKKKNLRGEAINHVCICDEHQVQPTTSPLPSCGHAHFLPTGLKQLSDLLRTTTREQKGRHALIFLFCLKGCQTLKLTWKTIVSTSYRKTTEIITVCIQASVSDMNRCHRQKVLIAGYWWQLNTSSGWCCLSPYAVHLLSQSYQDVLTKLCFLQWYVTYCTCTLSWTFICDVKSCLCSDGWYKLLCVPAYVALLWGESTDAHSGGVGLDDAVNLTDVLRRHAEARTDPAHRAVGWCHKWIRPCNDMMSEDWSHVYIKLSDLCNMQLKDKLSDNIWCCGGCLQAVLSVLKQRNVTSAELSVSQVSCTVAPCYIVQEQPFSVGMRSRRSPYYQSVSHQNDLKLLFWSEQLHNVALRHQRCSLRCFAMRATSCVRIRPHVDIARMFIFAPVLI